MTRKELHKFLIFTSVKYYRVRLYFLQLKFGHSCVFDNNTKQSRKSVTEQQNKNKNKGVAIPQARSRPQTNRNAVADLKSDEYECLTSYRNKIILYKN